MAMNNSRKLLVLFIMLGLLGASCGDDSTPTVELPGSTTTPIAAPTDLMTPGTTTPSAPGDRATVPTSATVTGTSSAPTANSNPTSGPSNDPTGPDQSCDDFQTWRDAQDFYEAVGGPSNDPHGLDSDGDGIACGSLPGAPGPGTQLPTATSTPTSPLPTDTSGTTTTPPSAMPTETISSPSPSSFLVTTEAAGDDAIPGDGRCETLHDDECTLQAAVQEANEWTGAITIHLPTGTYAPDSTMGKEFVPGGGGSYRLWISNGELEIVGEGAEAVYIIGSGQQVIGVGPDASLHLQGVTVQEGSDPGGQGGGISNEGTLLLEDVVLQGNHSHRGGGGLYNSGDATVRNTQVTDNIARNGGGFAGGIYNTGVLSLEQGSVVRNNSGFHAGGIFNVGSLTLNEASVNDNSGSPGVGGIRNDEGTVDANGFLLAGNLGLITGGYLNRGGSASFQNGDVSNNEGELVGGISIQEGSVSLSNMLIGGNVSTDGMTGGLHVLETAYIEHTTFSENDPVDCTFDEGADVEIGPDVTDSDGTCT